MDHPVKIGGRNIVLRWTQEVSKRFTYRLQTAGGHPTQRELTGVRTRDAAACKIIWALLPASEISNYPTPEDLFVAIDHDTESLALAEAISSIYGEMNADVEKKSTSKKSPSQESNLD